MSVNLLILPGDGIGPEITAATVEVLRAVDRALGLRLQFRQDVIGLAALAASGATFPEHIADLARAADGVVLGPVSHNIYPPRSRRGSQPFGATAQAP